MEDSKQKAELQKALEEVERARNGRSESDIPLSDEYWKLVTKFKKLANT